MKWLTMTYTPAQQHISVPRTITHMAREHRLGKRRSAYGHTADITDTLHLLFIVRLMTILPFIISAYS
jgi:hypothetical protein